VRRLVRLGGGHHRPFTYRVVQSAASEAGDAHGSDSIRGCKPGCGAKDAKGKRHEVLVDADGKEVKD
jgi:hypothetical protein